MSHTRILADNKFLDPTIQNHDITIPRGTSIMGIEEKRSTAYTANFLFIDSSGSTSDRIGRGDKREKI